MDWNIAKRNLIILLLFLNISLIVSIYNHNNNVSIDNPYFSTETLDNFNKLLSSKDISLDVEIPRNYEDFGIVDVEYETINNMSYPLLFDELKDIESSNNFKKAIIKLPYDDILVTRRNYRLDDLNDRLDFSNELLSIYFSKHQFDIKMVTEDLIYFNTVDDGIIYEDSYVKFNFEQDAIYIEVLFIIPLETVTARRAVITPIEAILILMPNLEEGDIIKKIDLIYYFELNEEELYKVKNARALPSWRIITEDGKVLYAFALKK